MKNRAYLFANPNFEKKYKRLRLLFILFILLFAAFIYITYDYLAFKILISYNYAYTDILDEVYEEALGPENVQGYRKDFDNMVIAVVTAKLRAVSGDRYTYLYTPKQYTASKEYTEIQAQEAEVRELSGDTVYLGIPNISKFTRDFLKENRETLNDYDNIIIDLQSNSGGSLSAMYKMADHFLDKGVTIAYEETRSAFTSNRSKAKAKKYFNFNHIVILINESTASAAEGFTMALKENLDNVTIVGETSFGKGIGQVTIKLKRGYAVKATVMQTKTPLQNSIHQEGIEPDVPYEKDDIIDFALDYIETLEETT